MKRLLENYESHIAIPWRDAAAAQRVIFCVYNEVDELRLRAKIGEFEIATKNQGHGWIKFDLTNTFAEWLNNLKYVKSYYQNPELMGGIIERYVDYIEKVFEEKLKEENAGSTEVVALYGVASVFGFVKVKELVDQLSPKVKGRLLVFFPGSYENNNYRLLDGYDGWNYHALPITSNIEN
jgi:hypothetical protein